MPPKKRARVAQVATIDDVAEIKKSVLEIVDLMWERRKVTDKPPDAWPIESGGSKFQKPTIHPFTPTPHGVDRITPRTTGCR